MSILFSSLFSSGGGGSVLVNAGGSVAVQVNSGASGVFVTITPSADQYVRLNLLTANNTEVNIQVRSGGVPYITGTLSQVPAPASGFAISPGFTNQPLNSAAGVKPPFMGRKGEVVNVVKTSGTTGNTVYYNYDLLEAL